MEWLRFIGLALIVAFVLFIFMFTQSCASHKYDCKRVCTVDQYNMPIDCHCEDQADEEIRKEAEKLIR